METAHALIRVHFAHTGHPLFGDPVYGGDDPRKAAKPWENIANSWKIPSKSCPASPPCQNPRLLPPLHRPFYALRFAPARRHATSHRTLATVCLTKEVMKGRSNWYRGKIPIFLGWEKVGLARTSGWSGETRIFGKVET